MKTRLLILTLVGISVALIAGWFVDEQQLIVTEQPLQVPDNIDYYLADVNYRAFDESGQLRYRLQTPYLEHYIREDISQLTAPDIRYHAANAEWHLSADLGSLQHESEIFELQQQARLQRVDSRSPLSMTSQRFIFHSREELLEIPQQLQVETHAGRMIAASARIDLARRLHRFHRVSAQYRSDGKDAG